MCQTRPSAPSCANSRWRHQPSAVTCFLHLPIFFGCYRNLSGLTFTERPSAKAFWRFSGPGLDLSKGITCLFSALFNLFYISCYLFNKTSQSKTLFFRFSFTAHLLLFLLLGTTSYERGSWHRYERSKCIATRGSRASLRRVTAGIKRGRRHPGEALTICNSFEKFSRCIEACRMA